MNSVLCISSRFSNMAPKRKAAQSADEKRKRAKTGEDFSVPELKLSWSRHGAEGSAGVGALMALDHVDGDQPGCVKVASFDIDCTVIKTKSGRKFATGAKDWTWLYDCIPDKLRELHEDGYRVVFFTNQAGIEKQKVKPQEIMTKVNAMIKTLGIPVFAYVSTGQNEFRKPSTLMWDYFLQHSNKGVEVKKSKCFYVGDAAGRAKGWDTDKPKDFSCSDRMLAANIGIDFKTPEEFFLGEPKAKFQWHSINAVTFLKDQASKKGEESSTEYHIKEGNQEMVIMVGPPASGKSTFCKRFLAPRGYVVVNRDTLKTPNKCMKVAEQALEDGSSVVIDNTNPSKVVRKSYIKIAKDAGVPCRCFPLKTSFELAHHLNFFRTRQTNGTSRRIPNVAFNMYKSNYEEPSLDEGFSEMKCIPFSAKFDSKKDEDIFKQWNTAT